MPASGQHKDTRASNTVTFLPPWDGRQRDPESLTALRGHVSKHAHRTRYGVLGNNKELKYGPQACRCDQCQLENALMHSRTPYCGRSDPFDALSVSIDAIASQYLIFGRSCARAVVNGPEPPDLAKLHSQAQLRTVRPSETLSKVWSTVISAEKAPDGKQIVSKLVVQQALHPSTDLVQLLAANLSFTIWNQLRQNGLQHTQMRY